MDKIIQCFIQGPEKEFYVREIAKKLKKSPTTISKYLKVYEKEGILISSKKLNHLLFQANFKSRKYKNLKLNYNFNSISDSGLLDFLIEEYNYPEAIILFGSFAKAENSSKSDIDILIVSPSNKKVNLGKFEKKLSLEIQLFIHSVKDIEKLKKQNKELFNSWVNGITLFGNWEAIK